MAKLFYYLIGLLLILPMIFAGRYSSESHSIESSEERYRLRSKTVGTQSPYADRQHIAQSTRRRHHSDESLSIEDVLRKVPGLNKLGRRPVQVETY